MKKSLSLILTFVIIFKVIGVSAFAAEGKEIQVQIPCQYTVWYDIKEGNINGYLIDGNVYVTSSTIGMLTGYNAYPDDSFITFMKDDRTSSFFYRLDLANGKLIRHAIVTQTEWDIDIKKLSNGSYAMNLEEMLLAMNVQIAFSDDEEYLLCTYLPYSVYDAWLAFQKSSSSLFSWVEIEEDQGDIDPQQVGILSAINSLYIDYNDHFVTDAFIAWWTDDVLTATEEQYMDAMTEILLCMAEDHNSFLSDDDLYKTYKHDNKAVGLAVKLLKLLDVDEEISDITKILGTGSSFVGKGITVLDLVNTLYQYRSISETQRDVLKELFVNFPMYAQATDSASRHIYNAANKLNQRIEEGAVGTTATICDAVVDLFIGELEGTITEVTPVLAIVKAVATIIKITPGLSDLADTNKHINLGCDTWVLLMLSIYNYNCWADNFYSYSFPTEDGMTQLKLTMLFRIMASITARQHFIKTDTLQESTVTAMNSKNQDLTKLYFLIESSKPITAPINNSPTINWDNYIDEIQSDFDNRDLADNDIFSTYLEAAGKTTATGSWTEDMNMTASMVLKNGSSTTKTKATLEASVDIEGWNGTDTSSLYMSGSASMSVLSQTIAYTMTWQSGVAHYDYTEPTITSADVKIDPSYFDFGSITQDMVSASNFLGNTIKFTVRGDAMAEVGISAVSLMDGIENLQYGDIDVIATVNTDTGKIDALSMSFHASMTYQGYDAEVDYVIEYRFFERKISVDENDLRELLQQQTDKPILQFYYDDYDSNGAYEAFAVVGEEDEFMGDGWYYNADIWFVSENNVIRVKENIYGYANGVLNVGNYSFLSLEKSAGGSGSVSLVFGVKDELPQEMNVSESYSDFNVTTEGIFQGYINDFSAGHQYICKEFLFNEMTFEFNPILLETISKVENSGSNLWKYVYLSYIQDNMKKISDGIDPDLKEDTEYQLIYIDDNNIPELWICYPSMADGSYLCTFDGKNVDTIYTGEHGSLSYIEHGGILYTSGGYADVYWDEVYTLQDGQFVRIARGDYGAENNSNVQIDENGSPIYQYNWNGTEMTEEEYQRELAAVFDFSASGSVYANVSCNYFSILEQLS